MKPSTAISRLLIINALFAFAATAALSQNPVWFRVNMKAQARLGNFNPTIDTVNVAVIANGWTGLSWRLMDVPIVDSIFESIVPFPDLLIGERMEYRFSYCHRGVEISESVPSRSLTLLSGGQIPPLVWFNNDSLGARPARVVFAANMLTYILNGQFNVAADTLVVRGNFNSWYGNDHRLLPTDEPSLYRDTVTLSLTPGAVLEYKYVSVSPAREDIWESGANRIAAYTGASTFVIETAKPMFVNTALTSRTVDVKFVVDTRTAYRKLKAEGMLLGISRTDTARSLETVRIVGSQPTLNGWQWSDGNDRWRLYDDGTHGDIKAGDSLFSTTVSFPQGTQKGAEYKYSINLQDNEAGSAKNHLLNINDESFAQVIQDVFGSQDTLYARYGGLVSVTEASDQLLPLAHRLEQNFPNPFNPHTTIRWSLGHEARVTLRVYDVLGREVAALIDGYKQAGHYRIEFDGTRLASGVYLYKLEVIPEATARTGDRLKPFAEFKRMVLVK